MLWRYWAQDSSSDPPAFSPVVREGGERRVLVTITAHELPVGGVLLGRFVRRAGASGFAVPLEDVPAATSMTSG